MSLSSSVARKGQQSIKTLVTGRVWRYVCTYTQCSHLPFPIHLMLQFQVFFQAALKIKIHLTLFTHLHRNTSYTWHTIMFLMIGSGEICRPYINMSAHVTTSPFIRATGQHFQFIKLSHIYILTKSRWTGDFKRLSLVGESIYLACMQKSDLMTRL